MIWDSVQGRGGGGDNVCFTFEDWADVPDWDVTLAHELSQPHLQEEERGPAAGHKDEVGDQEGAA